VPMTTPSRRRVILPGRPYGVTALIRLIRR
jgi:hypothetical protein